MTKTYQQEAYLSLSAFHLAAEDAISNGNLRCLMLLSSELNRLPHDCMPRLKQALSGAVQDSFGNFTDEFDWSWKAVEPCAELPPPKLVIPPSLQPPPAIAPKSVAHRHSARPYQEFALDELKKEVEKALRCPRGSKLLMLERELDHRDTPEAMAIAATIWPVVPVVPD